VLRPSGRPVRSVVVFLHGWGATSPFEWHLAWFDHLLARGSAVIFPQYQPGSYDDPQAVTPFDLRLGLRTGFARLGKIDVPVVVAGFSFGACLAFYYAANAASWAVPAPAAVYSVFPTDPRVVDPTLGLPPLHRTRVIVLVGEDDSVVGRVGADTFWTWLEPLPRRLRTYRVVRSSDFLADHEAPTFISEQAVRRAFWTPLDGLITASG
jgi:pimeloyl-ACP methyl ester carboxylesterase